MQQRVESDAKAHGYFLNPDPEFLKNLLEGHQKNEDRYGYPSCPCRLASGKLEFDRDIICPCDYRDPDCEEFGYCYCALYVRNDVFEGKTSIQPIPERRLAKMQARAYETTVETSRGKLVETPTIMKAPSTIKMKLWYCKQCGYVCFREDPPYICPLCKAKRELFAEMTIHTSFY